MRRSTTLGVVTAASLTLMASATLFAGPANADASGCTLAPGRVGSSNCIDVYGTGLFVNNTNSSFVDGWIFANVCNRLHQWNYKVYGATSRTTTTFTASGCIPSAVIDNYGWDIKKKMSSGSTFCARVNNTETGSIWSNFACETITP